MTKKCEHENKRSLFGQIRHQQDGVSKKTWLSAIVFCPPGKDGCGKVLHVRPEWLAAIQPKEAEPDG